MEGRDLPAVPRAQAGGEGGVKKRERDQTDAWVHRVNRAARELDEAAASMHPSAWRDELEEQRQKYKKACGGRPK